MFTVDAGIVTSAAYIVGSPEYNDIVGTQLPALSAEMANIFKKMYIGYRTSNTQSNSFTIAFDVVPPVEISAADLVGADITWSTSPAVSSNPVFSNFALNGGFLSVDVDLNYTPSTTIEYCFKLMKAY